MRPSVVCSGKDPMFTRSLARRTAVALTGGALVASGLLATGPAPLAHADAGTDTVASNAAATWLGKQLGADNLVHGDVAKTIDFALALKEAGGGDATLTKITAGVDAKVDTYAKDGVSYAQAALFYQAIGVDPRTKAGDLIASLEGAVDDTTGEMTYAYGGAWSQALAVRALHAANSTEAAKATTFLINDKCPTGGWGYWDTPHAVCSADADDTADMLFALLPQKGASTEIDDAIAAGVAWLKGQQKADGGFDNWGENASSTGLSGHALALAGATAEAQKAAVWLRRHQVSGTACDLKLTGQAGAVGTNDTVIDEGRQGGLVDNSGYDWYLATAQSIVALKSAPAATTPLTVSAPAFVHASTTVQVKTTGLAPGANGCVTLAGTAVRVQGGATTTAAIAVPAGTHRYAATLSTLGGSKSVTVQALAAKTLKVATAKRVKARAKLTVKVSGLAAHERVTVTVGAKKVSTTATAAGQARVVVKVGKRKGATTVKVRGQFADRKGKATTRVV